LGGILSALSQKHFFRIRAFARHQIEEIIQQDSMMRTEVISQFEALEDHQEVHTRGHFEKFDE